MNVIAERLFANAPQLSVGIVAADLLRLEEGLVELAAGGVEVAHVDVIDGVFCPGLTVGPPIIKAIPDSFLKDVHLMVDEPIEKLEAYLDAGANILTFHIEATLHPHRILQVLAECNVVRGVALNPGTPVATVEPLLDELELLLILAVNPGRGGQHYVEATDQRVAEARSLIGDRRVLVGVDGGITKANIGRMSRLGFDLVVTGSAVFQGARTQESARDLATALRAS